MKRAWYKTVKIDGGSVEGIFPKDYLETLGNLLAVDLTKKLGLPLTSKRWFMFVCWERPPTREVKKGFGTVISIQGDLIGPDSIGDTSTAWWQEVDGKPFNAQWIRIPVRSFQERYGTIKPPKIDLGTLPFKVRWLAWWETHLPDFYAVLNFQEPPSMQTQQSLNRILQSSGFSYCSTDYKKNQASINVKFDFELPVSDSVTRLVNVFRNLHAIQPLLSVNLGPPC